MSEPVAKTLFCKECDARMPHNPSKAFPGLYFCKVCRTLTNEVDPIHTHTQGVTPSYKIDGIKDDDRVVRQKSEEKREGERE